MERCEICRYFTSAGYFCRRSAPRAVSIAHRKFERQVCERNGIHNYTGSIWPIVKPDDWCGEFKEKEAK